MAETVDSLILDLLEWLDRRERTYQETMEAWRTSCPRLPVWEEANQRKLIETSSGNGRALVGLTSVGAELLKQKRPASRSN
jgi:hypothetical protein